MSWFNISQWDLSTIFTVLIITAVLGGLIAANPLLKRAFPGEPSVDALIVQLETNAGKSSPDWSGLQRTAQALQSGWPSVRKRLQYNGAKDDLRSFELAIDQLLVAIAVEDRSRSLSEITLLRAIWSDI